MCLLNDNLLSRVSPRCFWFELSLISELLKKSGACEVEFSFLEKIISCACLVQSGLNDVFHWYALFCIFNRSLLSVEAEVFTQFTMLNKKVSSAKTLTLEFSPLLIDCLHKSERTVAPVLTLAVRQIVFKFV